MTPRRPESSTAVEFLDSPNHGERRGKHRPDALILHYTGMANSAAAQALLCNPAAQVSCHYFVWEDGRIVQLVAEGRRAWHAGLSYWQGERDLNSVSIGIEIANAGHDAGLPEFPDVQIAAVVALCRDLIKRLVIPPQRILAHSDIAPLRKRDPGEKFPWAHLHRQGIGHYVESVPIGGTTEPALPGDIATLQTMLARYGYEVPVSGTNCARTRAVLQAFQRHFRPERVDGVADLSTVATLRQLIRFLPS